MILNDLQKVFETLDHGIILKKQKYIGFSPENVRWFESYLKKRDIIISLDKSLSELGPINWISSRVHLGSYTFLLYVNDMKSAVNYFELRLYANNTCILFNNENVSLIENHLNAGFESLQKHLQKRRKNSNSILQSNSQDVFQLKLCLENPWQNRH